MGGAPPISSGQAGRRRVLVIDDEPGVRRYVSRALGAAGYLVDEAAGGRAGIELVKEGSPDLVLLDLGLPDMSGEEVLRHIRASRPRLPVIVWTAAGDAQAERDCRLLGSDAFLHKPLTLAALLHHVGGSVSAARPSTPRRRQDRGGVPLRGSGTRRR